MVVSYNEPLNILEFKTNKDEKIYTRAQWCGYSLIVSFCSFCILLFYVFILRAFSYWLFLFPFLVIGVGILFSLMEANKYTEVYFKDNGIELLKIKESNIITIPFSSLHSISFIIEHSHNNDSPPHWTLAFALMIGLKNGKTKVIELAHCINLSTTTNNLKTVEETSKALKLIKDFCLKNYGISLCPYIPP